MTTPWPYDLVMAKVEELLRAARKKRDDVPDKLDLTTFVRCINIVADELKDRKKKPEWAAPFTRGLAELHGDLDAIVRADPLLLYTPAHEVALAFHMSLAFCRYNRSANRTSKSQTAYIEHAMVATGRHRWREFLKPPCASFLIGVNFSQYAPNVFERKMLTGEAGNELSPLFPEGGKWFNRYDERKHIIYLACPDCAKSGKATSCKHMRSTITLYSDEAGPDVLQGAQFNLGHFDEHISEEFYDEAVQRLQTVPKSSLMVTGTPLLGKSAWEHERLTSVYLKGPKHNRIYGTDTPFVSVHSIDQYAAGLVPVEQIETRKLDMDPLEQEARIYGRPAPLAKRSIFDRIALHEMENTIRPPIMIGNLDDTGFVEDVDGELSIWEKPDESAQYIIGCDVATGLVGRGSGQKKSKLDYSCATVIRVPDFRLVAQLHGAINPLDYADRCALLGYYFNEACLVVERTGLGIGVIVRLKEIMYPNMFRDLSDPSAVDYNHDPVYGVDTNVRTKSNMVACLQQVIHERQLFIPCAATLEELRAFGQETTKTGLSVRMRGEGGAKDDRVMSLVFAIYVAIEHPMWMMDPRPKKKEYSDPIWRDLHAEIDRKQKGNLW
jgi:hypothetical protein